MGEEDKYFSAVLQEKMGNIEKKLDEISMDFKEMVKIQAQHGSENALNKKSLNDFGKMIRDHDTRLKLVEEKQIGLITKVSIFASGIVLISAAFLNKLFK